MNVRRTPRKISTEQQELKEAAKVNRAEHTTETKPATHNSGKADNDPPTVAQGGFEQHQKQQPLETIKFSKSTLIECLVPIPETRIKNLAILSPTIGTLLRLTTLSGQQTSHRQDALFFESVEPYVIHPETLNSSLMSWMLHQAWTPEPQTEAFSRSLASLGSEHLYARAMAEQASQTAASSRHRGHDDT